MNIKIKEMTRGRTVVKRNNKSFVIAMMATAVALLVILMIAMFLGVRYYMKEGQVTSTIQESSLKKEEAALDVKYTTTLVAVITDLTEEEISIKDLATAQTMVKPIDRATKVADAYNKTIPIGTLKKGDIVEIVYEEAKDRILSINKSAKAWVKNKVSGVKVNIEASTLKVFDVDYTYNKQIIVLNADGIEADVANISPCDIVTVQGIDNQVLSIIVEEAAGSIHVTNMPSRNGRLELDINKMIPLNELTDPIEVIPGKHKVVVTIKGYNSIVEEIEVAAGETYELSLSDVSQAYTNVKVVLNNTDVENYTIKIGNTQYAKGDAISIPQGTYSVVVSAEGYKTWTKTIAFEKANQTMKVTLQSEKSEEETKEEGSTSTNKETSSEGTSNNTEATGETKTIDIATDPSGAKVYINGVNKGTTPYKVTLPMGSYSVLLEKDGYEVYSTSILLDGSDDQTGFLYVLTPNE